MSRSGKLGTASILLALGAATALPVGSTQPISLVLAVLACVTGLSAALQGSKGWLAIPGLIVVVFLILLLVGLQAT
jgi:hypothetical protein